MTMKSLKERLIFNLSTVGAKPVVNESCTEFEINNWILSDFIVHNLLPIVGLQPYPLNELLLMTGALCRLRPTHLFEWGTHIGKSARVFYETSKKFELNVEIHSIDLPDDVSHQEHPGRRRGELVRQFKEIQLHQGDGISTAISIARSLKSKAHLLFFLDGDHSYESVVRELSTIMDEYPSADILVHDTFYQSPESHYNIGPYEAIKFALANKPNSFRIISTDTGLPGMTLMHHLSRGAKER